MIFESHRMLASFFSGVLLSYSGSLIQLVAQNDSAAPSTLGFEAYYVLLFLLVVFGANQLPHLNQLPLEAVVLVGILLTVVVVALVMIWQRHRLQSIRSLRESFGNTLEDHTQNLLLLGLCFNLFAASLFALCQFIFSSLQKDFPGEFWFGHFRFIFPWMNQVLWILGIPLWVWAMRLAGQMQVLRFGGDFALGLNRPVQSYRAQSLALAFLSCGMVTALFGPFSFLSLIFPHLLRVLPPLRRSFFLEVSLGSFLNGLFLMGVDSVCYYLPISGTEVPVGLVTSVLGPLFLLFYFLIKRTA